MAGPEITIRPARRGDETALFGLVRAFGVFERLEHTISGSAEALGAQLFGERPPAEAILAERDGQTLGFALFFTTYSTFLTRPGLYLEDLFVLEPERGTGVGTALFAEVVRIARERGAGRLEWAVLDWNSKAIAFYERMGATLLNDWRSCRITL
jgi:GNAT superfamily N-acetyltransferase